MEYLFYKKSLRIIIDTIRNGYEPEKKKMRTEPNCGWNISHVFIL